uniref:Ariadne domain-containing protein n=1 Tax=Chenopodium quinoa TaxID=63459 RepID=A0A803LDX0_CHEQI
MKALNFDNEEKESYDSTLFYEDDDDDDDCSVDGIQDVSVATLSSSRTPSCQVKHMVPNSQEKTHILKILAGWKMEPIDYLGQDAFSPTSMFAFYMFGNELFEGEMTETERKIKQNLFEDQQQQLEARVEQLSDLMEKLIHNHTIDIAIQLRI